MKHDFIENEITILSKQTLDAFWKQKNPAELIGLYCFYYYTAKWQKTNQPKATIAYCAKTLKWGMNKTRKNKQKLIDLNLIEDVRHIDKKSKKVKGWYVKVKYLWEKETHPISFGEGGEEKTTLPVLPQGGEMGGKCLSANNINALSVNTTTKVVEGIPSEYGKPEITKILNTLKEKFSLTRLDGSEKENRRYANLAIKKFGDDLPAIIEAAAKDEFWKNKVSSVKDIYYNGVKILQLKKGRIKAIDLSGMM